MLNYVSKTRAIKAPRQPPIARKKISEAEKRYRRASAPNMDETATCFCCLTKLMEIPEEQLLQCTCPCRQIRCTLLENDLSHFEMSDAAAVRRIYTDTNATKRNSIKF